MGMGNKTGNSKKKIIFLLIFVTLVSFILVKRNSTPIDQITEQIPSHVQVQPQTLTQEPQTAATNTVAEAHTLDTSPTIQTNTTETKVFKLTPQKIALIRAQTKSTLRIVFIGEYAFFKKHNRYTTDLKAIGYEPLEGTKFHQKFGFLDAFNSSQTITNESTDRKNSDVYIKAGVEYAPQAQGVSLEKARAYCRMGCGATADKFEAMAAANLDQDEDLDLWIINERKEIVHVFDDLAP